jgi:predicted DNA-binding WGR domain protein
MPNDKILNGKIDSSIKNETFYKEIDINNEKKFYSSKIELEKLCENNCVINSFDFINAKNNPRKFFTVQTIQYDDDLNCVIKVIKPHANDLLFKEKIVDWNSKR